MTISRNRSLVFVADAAKDEQLSNPGVGNENHRRGNGGDAVEALQEQTPCDKSGVIPWLKYAAKRVHRKKVAPDYAMIAYARRLKLASNVRQFAGKVA